MKIQSINNNSSISFNARFPKSEVNNLIKEVKSSNLDLSELYTLLKFLDKKPISFLNYIEYSPIKTKNNKLKPVTYFLLSRDEIIGQSTESKFKALCDACIKNNLFYKKYANLSQSAFKNFSQSYKNITEEEILKLSLNA